MSIGKSNDLIGNRTRDLPACIIVPQPFTQNELAGRRLSGMILLETILSPCKKIPLLNLNLVHNRFVQYHFQFIIHEHPINRRYILPALLIA
jgi:hypothetical protein